jgi:hypothetical protein
MTIIARAMALTGLSGTGDGTGQEALLDGFCDACELSAYAVDGAAAC